MVKRVQGLDADSNVVDVYIDGNINISEIDPDDSWDTTTEDVNNVTDSVEWVGARPKK